MTMRYIEKTKKEKLIIQEEILERLIINHALNNKNNISELKVTPIGSYAQYDCTFTSGQTKIIADAKIRKLPYVYSYIKEKGLFIEKYKYDNLLKISNNKIPYYINYVPINEDEGYFMLINLLEMEFKVKNIEIYIPRNNAYQERKIIDIQSTPKELIYIDYKNLINENKDFLNQLYLIYKKNNYEMQNLINIL